MNSLNRLESEYGNNDPKTLAAMNNLGLLCDSQNNFSAAEKIFEDVLNKKTIEYFGEDTSETLISMNTLALIYNNQNKFDEAEILYDKCLNKRKQLRTW